MDASKAGDWRPIHENHAIEVMAVAILFGQPLTDRILTRVLNVGEESAFNNGLKSRHLAHELQVTVDSTAATPQFKESPQLVGRIYNALQQDDSARPAGRISEQLQIDARSIVYRTWNYVSWSWQLDRLSLLVKPALAPALDAVSIAKVRLEYLDRFMFTRDASAMNSWDILKPNSPYVTPAVYSSPSLWHCHSGQFLAGPNGEKWLLQANLDAVDQPDPAAQQGGSSKRWLNIMTALEEHLAPSTDAGESPNPSAIVTMVDSLHEPLKAVLNEIISETMAQRIYLEA